MKSVHSTQREEMYVKFPKCSLLENYAPILKVEKVESYGTLSQIYHLRAPISFQPLLCKWTFGWNYSY